MLTGSSVDTVAIGTLIHRAAEDGRALVTAEIELGKRKLLAKIAGARNGIILLVAAVFLLQAALTTLLVGCALGLAHWVGPLGGAAIVLLVTLIIIAVLAKIAMSQFAGAAAPPTAVASS